MFEASLTENVPLAPMTTLGIGGPARYFAEISTTNALSAGIDWARSRSLPIFVLGGGSNILVADSGFRGLVLRISLVGVETRLKGDEVVIGTGSGEDWDRLVAGCVARKWAGFECLSGIPGRVGATPIQNVGAYGQETSETLISLEALDTEAGQFVELSASDCEFGYRTSRFKTRDHGRFIITRVTYRLTVGGAPAVRYPELQRHLDNLKIAQPSLTDVREAVLTIRRRKAMVIDEHDADSRSVGSFFVNPTLTNDEFEEIKRRIALASVRDEPPSFPVSDGRVKLSAAWLIEHSGIVRGFIHGNVGTSSKHGLAIINRGRGTAAEVVQLKELIQRRVYETFGVQLIPEPILVGFD
jgi:UDP-N-acetylmuramate dehydrogenase